MMENKPQLPEDGPGEAEFGRAARDGAQGADGIAGAEVAASGGDAGAKACLAGRMALWAGALCLLCLVASLVLGAGIAGWLASVFFIAAIALGIGSLIRAVCLPSRERAQARRRAGCGLLVAIAVGLYLHTFLPSYLDAQPSAKCAESRQRLREIARAIERFTQDRHAKPAWSCERSKKRFNASCDRQTI